MFYFIIIKPKPEGIDLFTSSKCPQLQAWLVPGTQCPQDSESGEEWQERNIIGYSEVMFLSLNQSQCQGMGYADWPGWSAMPNPRAGRGFSPAQTTQPESRVPLQRTGSPGTAVHASRFNAENRPGETASMRELPPCPYISLSRRKTQMMLICL